jgi:hypothetical protein
MSREFKRGDTLPVTGRELERAETNSAPLFPAMASASSAAAGPARSRALTPSRRGATMGSIPREQIPRILANFTANLDKYLLEADFEPKEEEVDEVKSNINDQLLLRYKIGRFNPPHPGHIELFINNIEEMRAAKAANPSLTTRVVILAGDGAKTEPRSKNPLNYLSDDKLSDKYIGKKELIEYLLGVRGYRPYDVNGEGDFEILNKGVPQKTLGEVFGATITPDISAVSAELGVSSKEDDATKLGFINGALKKLFSENYSGISFSSEIVPMEPITHGDVVYSATEIREFANNSPTSEVFQEATKNFYGEKTPNVYNAIRLYTQIPDLGEEKKKVPEKPGKLPKDKPFRTTPFKPKGGTKNRRSTKRRRTKKRRSTKRRR